VWNGTSWRRVPLPKAVDQLRAVSCVSPDYCVAVGLGRGPASLGDIVAWNGTAWAVQPLTLHYTALSGVSCASTTACLAVGSGYGQRARVARWNGQSWSLVKLPGDYAPNSFSAVSCSSASACTIGGYYHGGAIGADYPLIERWNGSHLVIQTAAQPGSTSSAGISAVSCPADNACIAAGYGANIHPYVEKWNGVKWRAMRSPAVDSTLVGLSCTSITSCTGVGSGYPDAVQAWQLSGGTWTLVQAVVPAGSRRSSLDGVWCASASDCMAVGSYVNRAHEWQSLAETWDGTGWTIIQPVPNRMTALAGAFSGVSCSGPDTCAAIGAFMTSDGTSDPLAETWNGSGWAVTSPLSPLRSDNTYPASISCPAATMCMAAGYHVTPVVGTVALHPWAAAWNGTQWTTLKVAPDTLSATLTGVSCASATFCVAVGTTYHREKEGQGIAFAWDGTHWTRMSLPPRTGSELLGVSCTSSAWCVAVGDYRGWLAEAWNGTTWTVQPTSGDAFVGAVSCTSPDACTGVGYDGDQLGAERWDGTSWTAQQPAAAPGDGGSFYSVSCASATACTAVGYYLDSSLALQNIIQAWDGSSWVAQQPASTGPSALASVSCTSPPACTAAGYRGTYTSTTQTPLAERSG
jgi:hypothetical protein